MKISTPVIGVAAKWLAPRPRLVMLSFLVFAAAGCGGGLRLADVDPVAAREALEKTLDGWKKGDAPAALKSGTPSIVAQDLDWLAGAKLVDYRVSGDGKPMAANLHVPVTLTLKTAKGKEVKKNVTYIVGTSPYLTVFRSL
jgi:hypothetical protein